MQLAHVRDDMQTHHAQSVLTESSSPIMDVPIADIFLWIIKVAKFEVRR